MATGLARQHARRATEPATNIEYSLAGVDAGGLGDGKCRGFSADVKLVERGQLVGRKLLWIFSERAQSVIYAFQQS